MTIHCVICITILYVKCQKLTRYVDLVYDTMNRHVVNSENTSSFLFVEVF